MESEESPADLFNSPTLFIHIDSFSRVHTRVSTTDDARARVDRGWMTTRRDRAGPCGSGPCVKNGNTETRWVSNASVVRRSAFGVRRGQRAEGDAPSVESRRESSGVVHATRRDGRGNAMSLAFDEFGRPFIIIKVREGCDGCCFEWLWMDGWMRGWMDG